MDIKVYVVVEFEALRAGLAGMIEGEPGMRVIGSVETLEEVGEDDRFRDSDVMLVDIQALNRADIGQVYRKIGEWYPALKILFLGTEGDGRAINPDNLPAYMGLAAVGFVLKDGPNERLLNAIRNTAAGMFVCEMGVIRHVLTRLNQWANENHTPNGIDNLSERELEVLRLVAQGRSNKEIAQELFLSEGTIKIHVSHIMTKVNLDRRTELVRFALSRGLVPLD